MDTMIWIVLVGTVFVVGVVCGLASQQHRLRRLRRRVAEARRQRDAAGRRTPFDRPIQPP